jgi:hypothetical protein
MRYLDSITDFFRSPKWLPNLALGGLCIIIPLISYPVLYGWIVTGLITRRGRTDVVYDDFDFDHFGTYLQRGLWPFLSTIICSLVLTTLMLLGGLATAGLAAGAADLAQSENAGIVVGLIGGCGTVLLFLAVYPMTLASRIGAAITQSFSGGFSMPFLLSFYRKVGLEAIMTLFFFMAACVVLHLAGAMVMCVGIYAAAALCLFSALHFDEQLYQLYLQRGGQPLTTSPEISPLLPRPKPVFPSASSSAIPTAMAPPTPPFSSPPTPPLP